MFLQSRLLLRQPSLTEVGGTQHRKHPAFLWRDRAHGATLADLVDLVVGSLHNLLNSLVHQILPPPSLIRAAVDRYQYREVLDRVALSYKYLLMS